MIDSKINSSLISEPISVKLTSENQVHNNQSLLNMPTDWMITGYSPAEVILATAFLISAVSIGISTIIKTVALLHSSK
jgi:hypothetical protein